MGGTGGPGSDRAAAQSGLQGAGLLSGAPAASATAASLGVEGAATPTSGALSGADGAIAAPVGPTSASDTPVATPGTPAVMAPVSNTYTPPSTELVQAPALPTSPGFTLAGVPNLGFPTGVGEDTPLGKYDHVPFGDGLTTDYKPPTITGDPIASPTAPEATPEYEFDMDAFMRDAAAYNAGNASWGKPALRPDAFSNLNKSYMKLKGT